MKNLAHHLQILPHHKLPRSRLPIWFQLSVATMVVMAVSISLLAYVFMERQRGNLNEHTIKLGTVSLRYVADNAKVPMLTEDALALNTLVNNVASVDGHYYAFVIDINGLIKAHTDHERIDKPMDPFPDIEQEQTRGGVTSVRYTLPGDIHVIDLSTPIVFQDKKLGEAHVGLSVDFIENLFIDERAFLAYATLIIILLGMVAAVIFSLRFSSPISALVTATSEIARGNYNYKVDLRRKDELGTLGDAFNRMGTELLRQTTMRESFGKYLGPEVLDMITRSPGQAWLKGQRCEASVLFADIRGFTAYSANKEPEEVVEKLNEFFTIATEVIIRNGGYIDKFIGDSVLAVFGVPVESMNHVKDSVKAAIEIQQSLSRKKGNGNTLLDSVGIGIASGVVVAGNIGSQAKMEYTVIGDCVNVASYLNQLASAGEIIIGSDTEQDLGRFVSVEPLLPQKIKGRQGLVKCFRITGMTTAEPLTPAAKACQS